MYLTGNQSAAVKPLLDAGELGLMNTPKNAYPIRDGWTWAADNGCFGKGYPGDARWVEWLARFTPSARASCLFATAPDVVGDARASLARSLPHLATIRALGYPVALVTQDGMTPATVPWDAVDWIFVGGSDSHKLGPEAKALIVAAHAHGKRIHVGRVNSGQRFAAFSALGCDTADGTFIGFGPDENLPKVLSWQTRDRTHEPLFPMKGATA